MRTMPTDAYKNARQRMRLVWGVVSSIRSIIPFQNPVHTVPRGRGSCSQLNTCAATHDARLPLLAMPLFADVVPVMRQAQREGTGIGVFRARVDRCHAGPVRGTGRGVSDSAFRPHQ